MIRTDISIVVFVLGFMLNGQLAAEGSKELSREQQIAEKLTLTADADETISLKASGGRFVGLYKRAKSSEINTGEAHGVVILLHGMGAHPD